MMEFEIHEIVATRKLVLLLVDLFNFLQTNNADLLGQCLMYLFFGEASISRLVR